LTRPELDIISPDKFIAVAKETGFILTIGQSVLDQACRQAASWEKQGLRAIPIAVNDSSNQFKKI
jgi:EAL domain-containing protein (putative c-di-GMP-specific phosphodiesterase class I)